MKNLRVETIGVPKVYFNLEEKKYYCVATIVVDEEEKNIVIPEKEGD